MTTLDLDKMAEAAAKKWYETSCHDSKWQKSMHDLREAYESGFIKGWDAQLEASTAKETK